MERSSSRSRTCYPPKCPRKRGASGSHLGVFLFICLPCSHRLGPFVMAPLATDKSGRIESREQREDWLGKISEAVAR
jgi:hypothetical protein